MRRTLINRQIARIIAASRKSSHSHVDSLQFEEQIQAANEAWISRRQLLGAAAGLGATLAL